MGICMHTYRNKTARLSLKLLIYCHFKEHDWKKPCLYILCFIPHASVFFGSFTMQWYFLKCNNSEDFALVDFLGIAVYTFRLVNTCCNFKLKACVVRKVGTGQICKSMVMFRALACYLFILTSDLWSHLSLPLSAFSRAPP